MKDIYQVLRDKEQAVARLRQEVEALRFCLPLLIEGETPALAGQPLPARSSHWPAEAGTPSSKPYEN